MDPSGHGLAGVRIGQRVEDASWLWSLQTAEDGSFALPRAAHPTPLALDAEHYVLLARPLSVTDNSTLLLWVAAKRVDLPGQVSCEGQAIAHARVNLCLPPIENLGLPEGLLLCEPRNWKASTDNQGHFLLQAVPEIQGLRLEVNAEDHQPLSRRLASPTTQHLELAKRSQHVALLRGQVRLPDGAPAGGAKIHVQGEVRSCDAGGRFEFAFQQIPLEAELVVTASGFTCTRRSLCAADFDSQKLCELDLCLGAATTTVRGRVLCADGAATKGCRVEVVGACADETVRSAVQTDRNGAFVLKDVAPGDLRLRVWSSDARVATEFSELWPGTAELTLVLSDTQ